MRSPSIWVASAFGVCYSSAESVAHGRAASVGAFFGDVRLMPLFAYTPHWEALKAFFAKFEPLIPAGYSGLVGIRLHRTGNPLTLELLGSELPDVPLYPMVLLELRDGELARSWEAVQDHYEVPWVRQDDFHRYRVDVMSQYHAEDLLEARAEEILKSDKPDEGLLKKALVHRLEAAAAP